MPADPGPDSDLGRRCIPLEGAFNFRDLGGYPAAGGRRTKWRTIFRSDALHRLSAADVDTVRRIRLRTVVDLRTPEEVERFGRGPLRHSGIDYAHFSVLDREGGESAAVPAPAGEDLAERYLWYLEVGRKAVVRVITDVANRSRHPLVFHCAAGKDRTGVVAALLLDLVGVDHDDIVRDYCLTGQALDRILARQRDDRASSAWLDPTPPSRLTVHGSTMELFLRLLEERHGGARTWALAAGVDTGALDRLAGLLLAGDSDDAAGCEHTAGGPGPDRLPV